MGVERGAVLFLISSSLNLRNSLAQLTPGGGGRDGGRRGSGGGRLRWGDDPQTKRRTPRRGAAATAAQLLHLHLLRLRSRDKVDVVVVPGLSGGHDTCTRVPPN